MAEKKQTVIMKPGGIREIDQVIDPGKVSNIFLVTGKRSYADSGVQQAVESVFSSSQIDRFSEFDINPQLDDIRKGMDTFRQKPYDLIIAAGGGTPIDIAKAVKFFSSQGADPLDILLGNAETAPAEGPPLLIIPTTAGSGSEATHFAVIYHEKKKYSLADGSMLPDYACIDGELTLSLPRFITAYTGMDVICQAVEAYWSVNSTDASRSYSRTAIEHALEHLLPSVETGALKHRTAMMEAAHYAGKAINITKTTAVHAFSYYFSTRHDIPHGQAVGLLLDAFILFNDRVSKDDISDKRGLTYVRSMLDDLYTALGASSAQSAAGVIRELRDSLSLSVPVSTLLTTEEQISEFFESVNFERLKNNPRLLTPENSRELRELLL